MQRDLQPVCRPHLLDELPPRAEPFLAPQERSEAGVPARIEIQCLAMVGPPQGRLALDYRLRVELGPIVPGADHVVELLPMDGRIVVLGKAAAELVQHRAEGVTCLAVAAAKGLVAD